MHTTGSGKTVRLLALVIESRETLTRRRRAARRAAQADDGADLGCAQPRLSASLVQPCRHLLWCASTFGLHKLYADIETAEGANGHLPNLDFINSASLILRNMGIAPLLHSYDPAQTFALPSFLASLPFASHSEVQRYAHAARNLISQVALTADGRILGPEGTFGKYRIDAITLFGVPAEGPHGFHSLGR